MGSNSSKGSADAAPWGPRRGEDGGKRVVVITGGNSGLGFESARQLLLKGYRVVLACRSLDKARAAAEDLRGKVAAAAASGEAEPGVEVGAGDVEVMRLDVSSLKSVEEFSKEFLSDPERRCDVLMLNAGIMMGAQRASADGFDLQLATNYLGNFHLVHCLKDRLLASAPARVITVSSIAARFGALYWDDVNMREGEYDSLKMYQQTKLMTVLFSRELGKRLQGTGVTSNSREPGIVKTHLSEGITDDPAMKKKLENGVSVEKGAETQVHLASSPAVSRVTSEHWLDCKVISHGIAKFRYIIAARHLRASMGPKLWDFTEKLLAPALQALAAERAPAAGAEAKDT